MLKLPWSYKSDPFYNKGNTIRRNQDARPALLMHEAAQAARRASYNTERNVAESMNRHFKDGSQQDILDFMFTLLEAVENEISD